MFSLGGISQDVVWGEVNDADSKMTVFEKDSSASALVLSDIGRIHLVVDDDGIKFILYRHKRIKILNKSGLEHSDISIPYVRAGNTIESINDLDAQSIDLNGKVSKISNKDIFNERINDVWHQKKLIIPNVQEGSVIEYRYTMESPRITTLVPWYFQEDIPVRFSQLELNFAQYFNYMYLVNQQALLELDKKEKSLGSSYGGQNLKEFQLKYTMRNLPAIKEEAHVTTLENHVAKIEFQLLSFAHPSYGRTDFLKDWESLADDFTKDPSFGLQIKKKNKHNKILEGYAQILEPGADEKTKVKLAYDFLVKNVKWNGRYGLSASDDLNKCFEMNTGNGVDINLMLVAILKNNGVDAWPALISTRSHGKYVKDHPMISQFNHVIAQVNIDNEKHFIDATSNIHPFDLIKQNCLNKEACVLGDDGFKWYPIEGKKSRSIYRADLRFEEDVFKGKLEATLLGYSGVLHRYQLNEEDQDENLEQIFQSGIGIEDFSMKNYMNVYKPLEYTVEYTDENSMESGDMIYVNPISLASLKQQPFKQEDRFYPVEFASPGSVQYNVKIKIPEGHAIEDAPSNLKLTLPNNAMVMTYITEQSEDEISIAFRHQINRLNYIPKEYHQIKDFYNRMVEKLEEQIVFKKI